MNILRAFPLPAVLIAILTMFTSAFAAPVAVNFASEKQVIRGFGGINHPVWIGDLTAAQRETAFGNGPNQLGFTVLRIWISDNSSQWSQELTTAKKAIEHGAIVFASPWNPPSSMLKTGQSTYNSSTEYRNTKIMRADKFSEYVDHLNAFIKYMKDNGVDLYAVSVQNEPDYGYHGDWTEWTGADILTFMKNHAGNINSRVITPEPFQYRKNELNSILNDPTALANTDIVGTHLYGTLPRDFAYPMFKEKGAGKELWMTEVYHPNSDAESGEKWPEALNTAVHVHRAMVDGSFQAYVWWYIRRSYSPMNENGTISKRGWMMAHFSKFVRPGYVRVDATPAMPKAESPVNNSTGGTGGTFVSAYKGEDGKVVIVSVNRDAAASSIEFTINGGKVLTMEAWRTTSSQNMAKLSDVSLSNGSAFSVSLPAQSVTTFVGTTQNTTSALDVTNTVRGNTPSLVTVRGRTLNVNAGNGVDSKVQVKVVNMLGKTVANFNAIGNAKLSLKKIPSGAYIVEARRMMDGYRTMSAAVYPAIIYIQ